MRKEMYGSIARKCLIAVLLVTAAVLLLQTDYFAASGGLPENSAVSPARAAGAAATASAEAAAVLVPRAVMVRTPEGAVSASAWDGEATEQAFRRFAAVMGEALGSAGAPEKLTEPEFRAGMESGCFFVDLGGVFSLGLLSDWLGAGGGGAADMDADMLYLGFSGEAVSLFFRLGRQGFYRCATATQAETLSARMSDFAAERAHFAWEDPRLGGVDPYSVILEQMPALYRVSGASAWDQADPAHLMEILGMNSYVASSYYDADGTLVQMEGGRTMRLTPEGMLYYRSNEPSPGAEKHDLIAAVNQVCRLLRQSAGLTAGDAEIMFSGMEQSETACTVYFDYCVSGVPLRPTEGHAAAVTISDGVVRWASISLRSYSRTEEPETVLPMFRAAAIASVRGETPVLVYADSGEWTRCVWVYEQWRQND